MELRSEMVGERRIIAERRKAENSWGSQGRGEIYELRGKSRMRLGRRRRGRRCMGDA